MRILTTRRKLEVCLLLLFMVCLNTGMEPYVSIPELSKLIQTGTRLTYKREEAICDTDNMNHIYQVASGFVKRFEIMNNGAINVQCVYGPGDVFSITHVFHLVMHRKLYNGPETHYYEALGNTTIYKLPNEALVDAIAKTPLLYKDFFAVAGIRFISDIQMLENKSLPSAEKRVAHILSFYIDRYGKRMNKGIHLMVPLTQQDIADVLSLTRETVSLAISALKEQGLIEASRKIVVANPDKLRRFAYE